MDRPTGFTRGPLLMGSRRLRSRDGDGIDDQLFFSDELRRTNRAIFVKLQYLLRY